MINIDSTSKIDVLTGDIKFSHEDCVLTSNAIGSCVVVIMYDTNSHFAGMSHILLPGKQSSGNKKEQGKYAGNSLDMLYENIYNRAKNKSKVKTFLIGGANVLKSKGETIAEDNVNYIKKYLENLNIIITKESTGGEERRSVSFDLSNQVIYYTIGDSAKQLLWKNN